MIASLVWKEYREHRAVWLTLAAFAVAAIVGVPWAFPPEPTQRPFFRDAIVVVAFLLAWMYGLLCGSMLLASETELGTQPFLDTLPVGRRPVWLVKALAGLGFTVLQVIIITVVVVAQGLIALEFVVPLFLALLFAAVVGLGWGLALSAGAKSVLGSLGKAILAQALLIPLLYFLAGLAIFALFFFAGGRFVPNDPTWLFAVGGSFVVLTLPWPLSFLRYGYVDHARNQGAASLLEPVTRSIENWRTLFWLATRQLGLFVVGMAAFALLAGGPVVGMGLLAWPLGSLVIGAVCGVTCFFDEQAGAYRFLGEQRLPLNRFWLVKTGVRLAVALLALVAMAVPAMVVTFVELGNSPLRNDVGEHFSGRLFGSPLVGETVPLGLFLFAPVLYGFAAGQVCGVLFRKALVALVVSLGVSVLLFSVWGPSLVMGGLPAWQVLLVPALLLLGGRFLLRPWTADRLVSWQVGRVVVGVVAGCVAVTAYGLWSRMNEIPNVAEPEGFHRWLAGLPKVEDNQAGMALRGGLSLLESARPKWDREAKRPLQPGEEDKAVSHDYFHAAFEVSQKGWPTDAAARQELGGWLDEVFKDECWARLAEGRGKPVGMLDDPRLRTITTGERVREPAWRAGYLLPARGLMLQQRGDPAAFVDTLDLALTIARNLENGGGERSVPTARQIEQHQWAALEHWLAALPDRADLLRKANAVLGEHAAWLPRETTAAGFAEYLQLKNSLDRPEDWMKEMLGQFRQHRSQLPEIDLAAAASRFPWEQERMRRLARGHHFIPQVDGPRNLSREMHLVMPLTFARNRTHEGHLRRIVGLEAARLLVALRLYQAEHGRPAEALADLVPGILPAVPNDPFNGEPMRYRLSKGEEIRLAREAPAAGGPGDDNPNVLVQVQPVAAGQGVVWSVGEDRNNGGGQVQGRNLGRQQTQGVEDLIFLVPMPAKGGKK